MMMSYRIYTGKKKKMGRVNARAVEEVELR